MRLRWPAQLVPTVPHSWASSARWLAPGYSLRNPLAASRSRRPGRPLGPTRLVGPRSCALLWCPRNVGRLGRNAGQCNPGGISLRQRLIPSPLPRVWLTCRFAHGVSAAPGASSLLCTRGELVTFQTGTDIACKPPMEPSHSSPTEISLRHAMAAVIQMSDRELTRLQLPTAA
jgi:hypothetical protein